MTGWVARALARLIPRGEPRAHRVVHLPGFGPVYQLDRRPIFPPPDRANAAGVLAVGGDLSVPRLLEAYLHGIFPWFEPGEPILWWCPDPRLVLEPTKLRVSRSLRSVLRKGLFEVRLDSAFADVVRACARIPRKDQAGTWISPEIESAYAALHDRGVAHSVECWHEDTLAGGLYGVCLGRCFFGESMFSRESDASKVALVALAERGRRIGIEMIDCQVRSEHLMNLGAEEIPRPEFLTRLEEGLTRPIAPGNWRSPPLDPSHRRGG